MSLQRLRSERVYALHDVSTTRRIESTAAQRLLPHSLMQRAGLSVARLLRALWPHARSVWVACGPGNNGGDGLEAARHLHRIGLNVTVTWAGGPDTAAPDSLQSWQGLQAAGLNVSTQAPVHADVCVDAMLGIGATRALTGQMADWARHMNRMGSPVLAVDIPSGLQADTGALLEASPLAVRADVCLSLLTLKPGLFTAHGRDLAREVWWDDLDVAPELAATAWRIGAPSLQARSHNSHKGSYGDVAVVGGARGMRGAAVLAGLAAMHSGAGRVYLSLLDQAETTPWPELMQRDVVDLPLSDLCVVAGCGAGESLGAHLSRLLEQSRLLLLDADALNLIASSADLQKKLRHRPAASTILTPHPLEAARLLGITTAEVQADRLASAQRLAQQSQCTVVLKGSGSVVASPTQVPMINPTGNALLAQGGTGDVLAGMMGACWAQRQARHEAHADVNAACEAVYLHGQLADAWPAEAPWSPSLLAQKQRR